MKRWVSRFGWMWVAIACIVPRAEAGLPAAATSVVPKALRLVGFVGGVTDPHGTYIVQVRDAASLPCPNVMVVLDLSNCPFVGLCPFQPWPGMVINCPPPSKSVVGFTDAAGNATFRIVGASHLGCALPGPLPPNCVTVSAAPAGVPLIFLGNATASTFDLDAAGGVNAADLSTCLCILFSGIYDPLADYDANGVVSAADLSLMLNVVLGAGSLQSCPGPVCI